jgi:flagellar basal body-associated protein FliL
MNLQLDRRAREQAKQRRRQRTRRAVLPAVLLAAGIAVLFAMSWGANEVEQAQRRQTRLLQQRSYQADELRRLRTEWLEQTSRERIVTRARLELGMVDVAAQPKEVIALHVAPAPVAPPRSQQVLDRIVETLRSYGRIKEAVAGEIAP